MKVKIFASPRRDDLEKQLNTWLETHPVSPDSFTFQYHAVYVKNTVEDVIEHTLVVFYVPMMSL